MIVLQEDVRLEEHGVSSQMMEDLLEIVKHPSLGLPIDEVQIEAMEGSKAAIFPSSNPLQEYIDRVCSIGYPLLSITRREVGFIRQIWVIRQAKLHDLGIVQHRGLIPYTGSCAPDPSHKLDWREVMSLYFICGVASMARDRAQLEPWGMGDDDWP